jgi:hypothetical protein
MRVRLEQQRAQSGAQCQRHKTGDHRRGRDRHGELTKELPGDARQKGRWHEHGTQRQGDRDEGAADLVHRSMRRLLWQHPRFDVALDILDHDDRIVDDNADRQHEAKQ